MFDRHRPCANCPFKIGQGELFQLHKGRLDEIMSGDAFQCHKTIDYDQFDDVRKRQGDTPQQCAGLMAVLAASEQPNTIMQVAERFGELDVSKLDYETAYPNIEAAYLAHGHVYVAPSHRQTGDTQEME